MLPVCSASVKGRLRSFREELRRRHGISLAYSGAEEGESSSGGHLGRMGLLAEPPSVVVVASLQLVVSSSSDRGGQEIFSLRVSVGLSAFSGDPCPRASILAVSTLTLASGESSTVGLAMSEAGAGLWIFGLG